MIIQKISSFGSEPSDVTFYCTVSINISVIMYEAIMIIYCYSPQWGWETVLIDDLK